MRVDLGTTAYEADKLMTELATTPNRNFGKYCNICATKCFRILQFKYSVSSKMSLFVQMSRNEKHNFGIVFSNFVPASFQKCQSGGRTFEPRCEKTSLQGFLPGPTQTRLYCTTTEDG